MADFFVHEDVVEEMLLRFNVNDLIRFKSVCKSWHSLITSPRFINLHLNHSYSKDRCSEHGQRRIYYKDDIYFYCLIGSSNGLVCILAYRSNFLVGNPSTREVRQLGRVPHTGFTKCYGFGYDSSRDDYKVIVGASNMMNQTCVYVFSLRSNVWRVIGDVKYEFITRDGILCNGALHWIVIDENEKGLIISYDLSKDEFKEIPLPEEWGWSRVLRISNEYLCLGRYRGDCADIWVMRSDVKQTWELVTCDHEKKYGIVYYWNAPPKEACVSNPNESWFSWASKHVDLHSKYVHAAPIFVESLVSPYVNVNL